MPIVNYYAPWQYGLMLFVIISSLLYAAPNLYGEYPAVAIAKQTAPSAIDPKLITPTINQALRSASIPYQDILVSPNTVLYRFDTTDEQLKAKEIIQKQLGENYLVALNLSPATPKWLKAIGAIPMKLGLDLQGGIHFLLQVDMNTAMRQTILSQIHDIASTLRHESIHYTRLTRHHPLELILQCSQKTVTEQAYPLLKKHYPAFLWQKYHTLNQFFIKGTLSAHSQAKINQETLEQTMHILRNRVNELGIAEAIVQQQGDSRISIDLPGIQDTTEAKNILGKTATQAFYLVDEAEAEQPTYTTITDQPMLNADVLTYHQHLIRLKSPVILKGSDIISATALIADETNQPEVNVRLNKNNLLFSQTTAENIGKPMGVVFTEVKSTLQHVNGQSIIHYHTSRRLISVATITSTLGQNFRITGLNSMTEARTLALLLRAGTLPTPITIIAERQIGPSLGKQNIQMGKWSVIVGMGLVMLFMALYYRLMGIIADIALILNLVLMIAILSLLGATLTLSGMAGIVLTVGMAVDANVLIFERIREEIRRGKRTLASIHIGYEKAWTTIIDANITTLIVMMILFGLGSGIIKGVAITVTIGLLTSMLTAITGTRALVTWLYQHHPNQPLSIGI